ncbi:MAG: nucleotidyltransferase domain-containing protein [Promethearchaeota archaeon]
MKVISETYKTILRELLQKLKQEWKGNLISLVLYGSVARGDFNENSDIDLLIVCENLPKSISKRIEMFLEIEDELQLEKYHEKGFHVDFSTILRTKKEAENLIPLYLDMVDDAVILYDKNNFFNNVLNRLREQLKKLGAKRIYIGKKWYWDLKPDYKFGEDIIIE